MPMSPLLKPYEQRRCVQHGYAVIDRTNPDRPTIRVNWEELEKVWLASTGYNLSAFCAHWDVDHGNAKGKFKTNVEAKLALRFHDESGFRSSIINRLVVSRLSQDREQSRRITSIISSVQEISELAVNYARAKLTKMVNNERGPNIHLPSQEVKRLVEISESAIGQIKLIMDLIDGGHGSDEDSNPEPVPEQMASTPPPPISTALAKAS